MMIGFEFYVDDPIESNGLIDARINSSLNSGNYEEAAAIAFFHALDLKKTINVLIQSPGNPFILIFKRSA